MGMTFSMALHQERIEPFRRLLDYFRLMRYSGMYEDWDDSPEEKVKGRRTVFYKTVRLGEGAVFTRATDILRSG